MLVQIFPRLKCLAPVRYLREFFSSRLYLLLVALLMTLGELFAIEAAVFSVDLILAILIMFFSDDTLGIVPIACCGYMTIAAPNNPIFAAREGRQTIFSDPSFQLGLFLILLIAVILLVARLVFLLVEDPHRAGFPKLFLGFVLLGGAYMLGGAFSEHYTSRTVLFGFVQLCSLCFFYFYFHFTVNWKRAPKEYMPTLFLVIGLMILVQIVGMYRNAGVFEADGSVLRGALYTGWGTYNNVGGIMAMTIPAPFYFAAVKKRGYLYVPLAACFLLATFLSQSRGSILFGAVTFCACAFWTFHIAKGRERRDLLIAYLLLIAVIYILLLVWKDGIAKLFASVIEAGTDDSSRFIIWKRCFEQFKENPVFGLGFYDTKGFGFEFNMDPTHAFIPARAHNTYIQLVATGGMALTLAYLYPRLETLWLLMRRRSPEKGFAFLVALALILTSVVDCHFFNIGPGILYGIVLCYAEGTEERGRRRLKRCEYFPQFSL